MDYTFLSLWFSGLDRALSELDEKGLDTLMTHCGRACSDSYPMQVYLDAYRASDSLDAFIARLNGAFGGMGMRRINGDTIEIVLNRCACDLVTDGYVKNPKLCQCSLKSLQYNWDAILGEGGAACTLEESILRGDSRCRFTVRLLPKTK
jgi:hypothetical protein